MLKKSFTDPLTKQKEEQRFLSSKGRVTSPVTSTTRVSASKKDFVVKETLPGQTFSGSKPKTDSRIDVTKKDLTGFDYDPVQASVARAMVESKSARQNNIFGTGFAPLDFVSSQFVAGGVFVSTLLSEAGGELGKSAGLGSYRVGITDKKIVDDFVASQKKVASWDTPGRIQQQFDTTKLRLRLTTTGGALTRGQSISSVASKQKDDFRFIDPQEFTRTIDTSEQLGRMTARTFL